MNKIEYLEMGSSKQLMKIIHLYYIKYKIEKNLYVIEQGNCDNRESEIIN